MNRRRNQTLEEMARAIFKSWFVDFDPVRAKAEGRRPYGMDEATAALFPDAFQDSELGPIPAEWSINRVGDVVHAVGGGTPSTKNPVLWDGGRIHWTTPKDLSRLSSPVLLDTERKITEDGLKKVSSGLLPEGTLLLSSRAPVGYLPISVVPIAINQGYIAIPPGQKLSPLFLLFWCQSNMEQIKGLASGTTFAEISKRVFRGIEVIVPQVETLKAFDQLSTPLFSRTVASETEVTSLSILRDTLLPKLLSGEIRVKDAERFVEEAT